MSFWDHFEELRARIKSIILVFLILWVLFMTFSLGSIQIGATRIPMLVPAYAWNARPIASQFFVILVDYLKPSYVQLSAKTPWDGALVQVQVAFFLAFAVGFPWYAYQVSRFIGPALRPSEKRVIRRMMIPVAILFTSGVLLDYFILLPFTFNFLYGLQQGLGVQLYLLFLSDFVSFVTIHLIAFGVAFQLPVIMYALAAVGIIGAGFWRRHWRVATAAIFVIAALITPDPSGVTMLIVGGILMGLFSLGYYAARLAERRRNSIAAARSEAVRAS